MDPIVTPPPSREEVYPPQATPGGCRRFTGGAVLAAVVAAVLGVSALSGTAVTQTGFTQLAAGSAAAEAGPDGAGSDPAMTPAESDPGAGGHGSGGHQAPPPQGAAENAGEQQAVEHTVGMAGLQFSPENLTVAVGDTVTWVNDDDVPHTVTVTDGPEIFESELLNPGDSVTFTFLVPGEYSYYCAVHPNMKASVLAQPAAGSDVGASDPAPGDSEPVNPAPAGPPPAGSGTGCVPSTAVDEGIRHIEFAHLQTSPGQQVEDLLDVDEYVLLHTVLVNDMLEPLFGGVTTDATAATLNAAWQHTEVAHLQRSPGGQVEDLLDTDQYVQTHTVLVQDMLSPHVDYTAC